MNLPTFLIIGAQKAGTTSIYEYLQQHPDIHMSPIKEPHFFTYMNGTTLTNGYHSRFFRPQPRITDLQDYTALFNGMNGRQAAGEASPSYLYSPEAPGNIASIAPAAKLIAILRRPADRAFSNHQMNWRLGQEPLESFEDALAAEDQRVQDNWGYAWHYARKGFYAEQVRRYRQFFPEEQLLVLLHDDLVRSPREFMRRVHQFLGIDDTFEPDLTVSSNVSGVPRNRLLGAAFRPVMLLHPYWDPRIPRAVRRQLHKRILVKPVMSPTTRRELIEQYRDDITKLQSLIGRDLSHWLA